MKAFIKELFKQLESTEKIVVELLGSPDAGKTMAIQGIASLLKENGISVEVILETRGKNLFPASERGTLAYNVKVGGITCERISNTLKNSTAKVVLVDKGYVDYLYFTDYYLQSGKCTSEEAEAAKKVYEHMNLMPDRIIILTCGPEIAAARCEDAVETRTVKVQKSIDSLTAFFEKWAETPKVMIDTSFMTKEETIEAVGAAIVC